jgi:hypothetical protein
MICGINTQASNSDKQGVHAVNVRQENFDLGNLAILELTYHSQILIEDAIPLLRRIMQRQGYIVSTDKKMP